MLTEICGQPGAGKTSLMISFALAHMTGIQAHKDLKLCNKLLAPLNAGGLSFSPPNDHLVFADCTIFTRRGCLTNYEVDGFHLGLAQDIHSTMFLPPNAQIYLDEAQKYFNSRDSLKLADFVSRFYELHRHFCLNITLAVQRPKLIDLNIRELAARVIYVHKMESDKQGKHILRSAWDCVEFDNAASAIAYVDSGFSFKLAGDRVRFEYNGNIFRHYNSYAFFPALFRNRYDSPFDCRHAVLTGSTREELMDFNDQHDYVVPETYYKKGGKK